MYAKGCLCVLAVAVSTVASRAEEVAFHTVIGDQVLGVSGDGTTAYGGSVPFQWSPPGNPEYLGNEIPVGFAMASSTDASVLVGDVWHPDLIFEAFRWTEPGGFQMLGTLPGYARSRAFDISGDGSIVVGEVSNRRAGGEAFYWTQSTGLVGLGFLPDAAGPGEYPYSYAEGISRDGSVIVGGSSVADGLTMAVRWENGQIMPLGDLAGGEVNSLASGASEDGSVIVGTGSGENGSSEAFRWTQAEGMVSLWPMVDAWDVSADGSVVVGHGVLSDFKDEPLIWDPVNGVRSLYLILEDHVVEARGWTFSNTRSISDDGRTIVGMAAPPVMGSGHLFMATIPEPSSMLLASMGAISALLFTRKHRRLD